jgi:hypothetical protein
VYGAPSARSAPAWAWTCSRWAVYPIMCICWFGCPRPPAVAKIAQQVKGATAHLVTHTLAPRRRFKWQGAYSASSVSPSDLDAVFAYISASAGASCRWVPYPDWEQPPDEP